MSDPGFQLLQTLSSSGVMDLPYPEADLKPEREEPSEYRSAPPRPAPLADSGFIPPAPLDLEQADLTESLVEELILKNIYTRGQIVGRELSNALGLRFSV